MDRAVKLLSISEVWMKKIIVGLTLLVAMGAYVILGSAASIAVGRMSLRGMTIEYDESQIVTVTGKASFVAPGSGDIPVGKMRLDSLAAQTISVELGKGADKKLSAKKASAIGGVTIKARRANKTDDGTGKTIQNVYATAQSAVMETSKDEVVLSGSVVVKLTEPGDSEPMGMLTGDRVVFSLKDNKIRIEGQSDRPADITFTPKEK